MRISHAIDRYDRHFPFFDGTLFLPAKLGLEVLQVGQSNAERDGKDRHRRMLKDGEFDAAEVSLSSYLMAKARRLPFTAIPAFPRRLFSQTQIFVRADSALRDPRQLAGKRIGLRSFQNTLAVVAKGDLAQEYEIDPRSIRWLATGRETIAFDAPDDWQIEYLAGDADPLELLTESRVDAVFFSRAPAAPASRNLRRLFADPRSACVDYHARNGYVPIMHVIALRDDVVAGCPEAPTALLDLYDQATRMARSYLDDPGWSQLVWAQLEREQQEALPGGDLWPVGFAANRRNLERFIRYSYEQGLIDQQLAAEELFDPSVT